MTAPAAFAALLERHADDDLAARQAARCIETITRRAPPPFASATLRTIAPTSKTNWVRFISRYGNFYAAAQGVETSGGPPALAAARLIGLIEPLLQCWEAQIAGLDLVPCDNQAPLQASMHLELTENGHRIAAFAFDDAVAASFANAVRADGAGMGRHRLPLRLDATIDGPKLVRGDLLRMLPGGALLLGRGGPVISHLRLAGGQTLWSGTYQHDTRAILLLRQGSKTMTANVSFADFAAETAPAGSDGVSAPFDASPISLHVRLPTWSEHLARVERLMPGDRLPLPTLDSDTSVALMAGGVTLAHGRLILVGEAVALLIDRLEDVGHSRG